MRVRDPQCTAPARSCEGLALRAPQVGYPADKPSGTLWMSQCQAVAYDYDGNQGIFKDVSQCTNEVRTPRGCATL